MKLTTAYKTVAVVGFTSSVATGANENPAAHGAVCLLQARKYKGGIRGRKINSNGRFHEYGRPFDMTPDELSHWQSLR